MNSSIVTKKFHGAISLGLVLGLGQILFSTLVFMSSLALAEEDMGPTKALMHTFVLEYAKLSPYLQSEQDFASSKGKETVKDSLNVLAKKVQRTPPPVLNESSGYKISYSLLSDHILKTKEVFERGELEYARMRMKGLGNLCSNCHMQVPRVSNFSAFEFVVGRSQQVTYENADFLFTIRRYPEAAHLFDELIRKYPESGISSDLLPSAYRQKLAVLVRVGRDAKVAEASLNEDLKNKNLPQDVRQNVISWLSAIEKWKAEKTDPAKLSTAELIKFAERNIPMDIGRKIAPGHPELLNLLRLSGLLYERLYSEKNTKNSQALLYYLARCERSLGPSYWYSINEIYLKECIVRFPKQAYSKRCFQAYEEGMRERYFGKRVPEPIEQSIEALKSYL